MRSTMSSTSIRECATPDARLRVGRIPYLNSEPFYHGMDEAAVELRTLMPRALGLLAERGEVDAGLLSLVDCLRLGENFESLGDFCLATRGEARSVLLFSGRPLEAMDGATIAVTGQTSTSVQLLKALLAHRYGARPKAYVELGRSCDAFLLIGDEALRCRDGRLGFPYLYDLAEEWYRWKGLPFVFALWVVRRDLPVHEKKALQDMLGECLAQGLQSLDSIALRRTDTGLRPEEAIEYLRGFRYVLGAAERQAIEEFRALMATP